MTSIVWKSAVSLKGSDISNHEKMRNSENARNSKQSQNDHLQPANDAPVHSPPLDALFDHGELGGLT